MTQPSLEELMRDIQREAERAEFPVDLPVYERHGKSPKQPIVCAGSLDAALCVVGRDLGKDEVRAGEPLIGQAGRMVRSGIISAWNDLLPTAGSPHGVEQSLRLALFTNIVPYKPPGNKAYPEGVRKRFRPFLERLLTELWRGDKLITLGSECFEWFERYLVKDAFSQDISTSVRFERSYRCVIPRTRSTSESAKEITLYPLPHPSPLNRRWFAMFPSMLAARLSQVRDSTL